MANNEVRGGKTFYKRRRRGGGWRRRHGFPARRGRRSDGTSDEDYVLGEEEDGSSYSSYSSDASRDDSEDAVSNSSTEEEEEEYEGSDEEELLAGSRRKPRAKPSRQKISRVSRGVDEVEEEIESPIGKPRARVRRRSRVSARDEGDEYEDDDDEDFAPGDDDGDGEQWGWSSVRKTGIRKNAPVKPQRSRARKSKKGRKKTPAKKRRRRTAPRSDDDDFVVDDAALVEGMIRKNKRSASGRKKNAKRRRTAPISDDDDFIVEDGDSEERTNGKKRKKKSVSKGKKRSARVPRSDVLDSDSSHFDFTISEEELRDLQVGGPLGRRERKSLSSASQGKEKRRGKEVEDLGKQICGICLSEEQNGAIRGLLDCCAHYFCFACIMEWSKVESRCPLCKQRFKTISQSARSDAGLSLRAIVKRIPKRDQVYQPSVEEMRNYLDPYAEVVCVECQQGRDDHLMLLCDICDSPAHTYCVGLGREVPEGNWYCDGCRSMDSGSSNSHVQESMVEHGTGNNDLLQDTSGEIESENATLHETRRQSAALLSPHQSLSRVGRGASSGCHSAPGDHGTPASGFAASTLSGRRSIHQRIRIMLSNNRIRWTPEGIARNALTQPSVESEFCNSEVGQRGETLHAHKESPVNGINERSNRSFLTPRTNMHPCTHNEASSFSIVEGAKARAQTLVKNHLKRLTRDNPLERRDFKDIARHATHTILAVCGLPHRRSMVTMPVQPPPSCVHQAAGELSGLVKNCCLSCFASFVGNTVRRLLDSKLHCV